MDVVLFSEVWTDKWITIRKIAVPLATCTAVATEIVGASVFDTYLGSEIWKISVANIILCSDEIIKYT